MSIPGNGKKHIQDKNVNDLFYGEPFIDVLFWIYFFSSRRANSRAISASFAARLASFSASAACSCKAASFVNESSIVCGGCKPFPFPDFSWRDTNKIISGSHDRREAAGFWKRKRRYFSEIRQVHHFFEYTPNLCLKMLQ